MVEKRAVIVDTETGATVYTMWTVVISVLIKGFDKYPN